VIQGSHKEITIEIERDIKALGLNLSLDLLLSRLAFLLLSA